MKSMKLGWWDFSHFASKTCCGTVESNNFNPLLLNSHQGPIFKILDHRKSLTIGWGRWAKGSWVIFGVGFPNPKADFGVEKVFGFITLFFARKFERWQKVDHLERIGSWNAIEGRIPRHGLGVCSFILQDSSRFFDVYVYDCSKTWEPKKSKLFQGNHISPNFVPKKKRFAFAEGWRWFWSPSYSLYTLFKRVVGTTSHPVSLLNQPNRVKGLGPQKKKTPKSTTGKT